MPKEYRFADSEVLAHRIGDMLLLMPKSTENDWSTLLASLDLFSEDFMAKGREKQHQQERRTLLGRLVNC